MGVDFGHRWWTHSGPILFLFSLSLNSTDSGVCVVRWWFPRFDSRLIPRWFPWSIPSHSVPHYIHDPWFRLLFEFPHSIWLFALLFRLRCSLFGGWIPLRLANGSTLFIPCSFGTIPLLIFVDSLIRLGNSFISIYSPFFPLIGYVVVGGCLGGFEFIPVPHSVHSPCPLVRFPFGSIQSVDSVSVCSICSSQFFGGGDGRCSIRYSSRAGPGAFIPPSLLPFYTFLSLVTIRYWFYNFLLWFGVIPFCSLLLFFVWTSSPLPVSLFVWLLVVGGGQVDSPGGHSVSLHTFVVDWWAFHSPIPFVVRSPIQGGPFPPELSFRWVNSMIHRFDPCSFDLFIRSFNWSILFRYSLLSFIRYCLIDYSMANGHCFAWCVVFGGDCLEFLNSFHSGIPIHRHHLQSLFWWEAVHVLMMTFLVVAWCVSSSVLVVRSMFYVSSIRRARPMFPLHCCFVFVAFVCACDDCLWCAWIPVHSNRQFSVSLFWVFSAHLSSVIFFVRYVSRRGELLHCPIQCMGVLRGHSFPPSVRWNIRFSFGVVW